LIYALFNNALSNLDLHFFQKTLLFGAYYVSIAFSAVIGAMLMRKVGRIGFVFWMAFGVTMSIFMLIVPSNSLIVNCLFSVLLGISIGFGLPSTLAYFADVTQIEKRGLHGGISWLAIGCGILVFATIITTTPIALGLGLLAAWRVIGIIFFVVSSKGKQINRVETTENYKKILARRDLLLYLIPWVMFSVINFIQTPISTRIFGDFATYVGLIEFALTGVFALIGGVLADRIGRKPIVFVGFIILGIEYAILTFFSGIQLSWYIFTLLDGVAWGMFAAVFFMSLWGDLAEGRSKEKYYVIGGLPFLLAGFLTVIVEPFANFIQPAISFSLASFFLFIAVLPLLCTPETLPMNFIKDRELKKYINKALKTTK